MTQIDFLASQPHYFDHIAPVWEKLPSAVRGTFFVPFRMKAHALNNLKYTLYLFCYEEAPVPHTPYPNSITFGHNPILVAAYGDLIYVHDVNPDRKIIMMEHGTGHTFGTSAYPNGKGKRDYVDLFLAPNQYTARKIAEARETRIEVVGTPKMDRIYQEIPPHYSYKRPPTIAIGFHHGNKNTRIPESGSAFEHYQEIIPKLHQEYKLLAYSHPLSEEEHRPFYEQHGIPYTSDLVQVLKEADVCINDLSSALYEFMTTGKPVIVLNAPWFRKDIQHGIRFWDYSDVGINVWESEELPTAIERTLLEYETVHLHQRMKAMQDLYPYFGYAAIRTAGILTKYLRE